MSDGHVNGGYVGNGFVDQVNNPTELSVALTFSGAYTQISWNEIPGAIYYKIFQGPNPSSMLLTIPAVTGTTQTVSNASNSAYAQIASVLANGTDGPMSPITYLKAVGETVYYGFSPSATPNVSQVEALSTVSKSGALGTYTLTQTGSASQYPCLAFPVNFTQPTKFALSGFTTGMTSSVVTIGELNYYVYISPYATSVTNLYAVVS